MVEPSAEEEKYQKPEKSTADYAEYKPPPKKQEVLLGKLKPSRKVGIAAAVIVLVLALAAGSYWFVKNRNSNDKPTETSQTAQNVSATEKISSETKKFESASFRLSFDYPSDWRASEDNPEAITVLSPDITLKDTQGKDAKGQIYFRIRAKGQQLQGFDKGDAAAVLASEKIAYTAPTQVQRASTYITFVRYAENSQGLDAIYITGDTGYEQGQSVLKTDIEKVDPIISVEFYLCPKDGCKELSGVYGIGEQTWQDPDIAEPLKKMLTSLVIN
jgi:hypothetical protein